jgi:hypothetical protein
MNWLGLYQWCNCNAAILYNTTEDLWIGSQSNQVTLITTQINMLLNSILQFSFLSIRWLDSIYFCMSHSLKRQTIFTLLFCVHQQYLLHSAWNSINSDSDMVTEVELVRVYEQFHNCNLSFMLPLFCTKWESEHIILLKMWHVW